MDLGFGIYFQFLLALIFVLALIGILTVVARRFGLGHRFVVRGDRRRLGIVEIMPLDAKRRLVLVSRDDTEHLIILGAGSETVVERGIAPGGAATGFAAALDEATS